VNNSIKLHGLSLGTTMGAVYIACAIFDALFPPYGFLVKLESATPWPIYGSLSGFLTGLIMFAVSGFLIGALYAVNWGFWTKRLS
jgi:hypothetical protein